MYLTLCGFFKEHFRADELGKKRYMEFMPWHFGFFCRYRPLPETVYGGMAREHPLLQTRLGVVESAAIAAADVSVAHTVSSSSSTSDSGSGSDALSRPPEPSSDPAFSPASSSSPRFDR